jgi:hypothetical protein
LKQNALFQDNIRLVDKLKREEMQDFWLIVNRHAENDGRHLFGWLNDAWWNWMIFHLFIL